MGESDVPAGIKPSSWIVFFFLVWNMYAHVSCEVLGDVAGAGGNTGADSVNVAARLVGSLL